MKVKYILKVKEDFQSYKDKLDELESYVAPHKGEPTRFPCLVVSDLEDIVGRDPKWQHLFIYSNQIEDLAAIKSTLDDEGIAQIILTQQFADGKGEETVVAHPDKPKIEDWEALWDKVEVGEREQRSSASQKQFDEYEMTRGLIATLSISDAIKAGRTFVSRWPGSSYVQLIIIQIKERQRQGRLLNENPVESPEEVSSTNSTHDYYPDRMVAQTGVPESRTEHVDTPEPRSRVTREARFVNDQD